MFHANRLKRPRDLVPIYSLTFDPWFERNFPPLRESFARNLSLKYAPAMCARSNLHFNHFPRYIEIFRSSSSEWRRSTSGFNGNGGGNGGGGLGRNGGGFNNDRMAMGGRGQRNNRTNFRGKLIHRQPFDSLTSSPFVDRPYPDTPWNQGNNNNNQGNDMPWRNNNRSNNFGGGGGGNFDGPGNNMFNNSNSNDNFSSGNPPPFVADHDSNENFSRL